MGKRDETSMGEMILYQTEDGRVKLDVRLQDETIWLTQADMADLFQVSPQNITIHLKNIYDEGELVEAATCKDFLQVQREGSREVERVRKFYDLDAVISVGYRVQSHIATRFRIWATQRLREYIVKGCVIDDAEDDSPVRVTKTLPIIPFAPQALSNRAFFAYRANRAICHSGQTRIRR